MIWYESCIAMTDKYLGGATCATPRLWGVCVPSFLSLRLYLIFDCFYYLKQLFSTLA